MFILGVDPGLSGALSLWSLSDRLISQIEAIYDLPTYGEDSKRRVDGVALMAILRRWPGIERAFVENVWAMPSREDEETGLRRGMGAQTSFKFGRAVGAAEAVIEGYIGRHVDLVASQTWKKHHGLIGLPKSESRGLAFSKWPELRDALNLVKHENRAEAALIGEWGVERVKRDIEDDRAITEFTALDAR